MYNAIVNFFKIFFHHFSDIPNFHFIFSICSIKYEAGSVTVFALSVKKSGYDVLTFPAPLSSQKVDVYLLTPVGPEGITSK